MTAGPGSISLVLDDVEDLFAARPADPLRGRFDDRSGVERLLDDVDASRDPLHIDITVTESPDARHTDEHLERALAGYAAAQTARAERDMLRIRRLGQQELVFGLTFLALCLLGGSALTAFDVGPDWLRDFLGEGLVIVGWIALWHPVDMLFFERLPLIKRKRVLDRIGNARVHLREIGSVAGSG